MVCAEDRRFDGLDLNSHTVVYLLVNLSCTVQYPDT